MIIDQFIRNHEDEKITLDFEGSNIKNLARFYKSFGADEFNYLRIKKNNLPGVLKIFKS
jgi:Mor family transcriptional regulator